MLSNFQMTPACLLCSPSLSGAASLSPSLSPWDLLPFPQVSFTPLTGYILPVLNSEISHVVSVTLGMHVCVCACVPSSEYVGRTKVLAWGTGCLQLHWITQAHCLSQTCLSCWCRLPTHSASQLACLPGWKAGYFVFCLETPIPERSPGSSAHPSTCGKHHIYSHTWYPCEEPENKGKLSVSWDAASRTRWLNTPASLLVINLNNAAYHLLA